MTAAELRAALARIVEADDSRREANASGHHASPISYWIPTEEAIEAARELLSRVYLRTIAPVDDDRNDPEIGRPSYE